MDKVAVIGAGISGLALANKLKNILKLSFLKNHAAMGDVLPQEEFMNLYLIMGSVFQSQNR